MDISSSPELAPEPVLSEEITKAADLHKGTVMGRFGKVSAATGGWEVFRGEFFGHGQATALTGKSLFDNIASTYGMTIATKVIQQLQLSQTDNTRPINSYKVAKAVALVESQSDWTKPHTTEISYRKVEQGIAYGKPTTCSVTLTPFGRLKSLATSLGVLGVPSTDINNKNVVNGWVEQMRMTVSSGSRLTTNFLRSGMLMPPKAKIKGGSTETSEAKTAREEIAKTRYTQILSAMVETNPNLIPASFNESGNSKESPLEIEHAHIGLLSTNDGKKPEELAMAEDQMNFLKDKVNGQTIQIDYAKKNDDGTVTMIRPWVKLKVHYTNFSAQKTQKEGAAALEADSPDHETEQTLNHYLGAGTKESALTEKMAALPEEEQKEALVLLSRLIALRQTRSQEGSSFYSYEFQTKYSLLLAKCGIPTHVYCKSGKDRTSRFSEMIKMWAANPKLKLNKMTRAVRDLIKAFSFSGNMTVQRLCTGFAGNKQATTYWKLISGEKHGLGFRGMLGGWTHSFSAAWYAPWQKVKT